MQPAILVASALLLLGFVLRVRLRLLQLLFIPASVIGGIVGLVAIQLAIGLPAAEGTALHETTAAIAAELRSWPGPLIAVVFAGLLLEKPDRGLAESLRGAALNGIMVWIIVLGQVALGLAAGWLVVDRLYDVPAAFGQLLEAGFAGGHGTAAALGTIYGDLLGFPEGLDLGLFVATVGLVYSVVSGIVLVNIAIRRRWTQGGEARIELVRGTESRSAPRPIALGRVRSEVIDPLAFQLLLVAAAVFIGAALQWAFVEIVRAANGPDGRSSLENVPLFLFTLIGGLLLRKGMALFGADDLIDGESIRRVVGITMEFLIVAAVASLRLEAVATFLWPLVLLLSIGAVWTAFCLLVLARRLLPEDRWFELGIINYGMSTGTTAQGMMLLRIVDRDLDTGAAEDYALAAPLSAPFIGGGVITMTLPLLLERIGAGPAVAAILVALIALYAAGRVLRRAWRPPPAGA
ncbi:MAG: sodium/glutamate symporter [Planctomycetota bacterium]|jgi:ESS family glutamate:Na+ symporter